MNENNKKDRLFVNSYVRVSLFGIYTEAFIDSLLKRGIKIKNIANKNGILYLECNPRRYPQISKIARGYGLRTKIVKRRGIYFKLRKYKKRYGAALGALNFLFIIVFMNTFIWDIKVTGNDSVTAAQITEQLKKEGITIGVNVNSYSAPAAELSLKLALDKLAWANIERTGSRLIVKVSERLEEKLPDIPTGQPCNVVALKTGRIVETEVYAGTLLLLKGSGVNKGDIIVSGITSDGAGNVFLNHADAKIIAECEDEAEFFVPFNSIETKKNGRVEEKDYILFLGNLFPLFVKNAERDNMRYSEEIKSPSFFGLPLPFKIKTCVYEYYDNAEVVYSKEETLQRLNRQIELYKTNLFGGDKIVGFSVEYNTEENGISAKTKTVYRTNIAVKSEIIN